MLTAQQFLQQISDPNKFNGYLLLGYVVMGLIVLVYFLFLWTKQRNLQQDINLLRQLLQDDNKVEDA